MSRANDDLVEHVDADPKGEDLSRPGGGGGDGRLPIVVTPDADITESGATAACTVDTDLTAASAIAYPEFSGTAVTVKEVLGLAGGTIEAGTKMLAVYMGRDVYGSGVSYGIAQVSCS